MSIRKDGWQQNVYFIFFPFMLTYYLWHFAENVKNQAPSKWYSLHKLSSKLEIVTEKIFCGAQKVRWFQTDFLVSSNSPKTTNEWICHSSKNKYVRSFFRRIWGYPKYFCNYLTFRGPKNIFSITIFNLLLNSCREYHFEIIWPFILFLLLSTTYFFDIPCRFFCVF